MSSLDEKSKAESHLHTSGEVVKQQLDNHKVYCALILLLIAMLLAGNSLFTLG